MRFTYYPLFSNKEDLENHFWRACWYIPKTSKNNAVYCGCVQELENADIDREPYMRDTYGDQSHIKRVGNRTLYWLRLIQSDRILVWRKSNGIGIGFLRLLRKRIINVDTNDANAIEYGTYCSLLWKETLEASDKRAIIRENRVRFSRLAATLRSRNYDAACVCGTGPSIEGALAYNFDNCLSVVCNSIVQNQELLNHIKPQFVCAGDVVSHFGVSKYAEQFCQDLRRVLIERDIYFLTTARFGHLFVTHYPEIREKTILVEQKSSLPVYDIVSQYELPKLDSTLNIHMLPLAATFSDKIFILGCDGKSKIRDNEDFWAHGRGAQYHSLVSTGHLCHPTFDVHRQTTTYNNYEQSVQATLERGERTHHKQYVTLCPSSIDALQERLIQNDASVKDQQGLLDLAGYAALMRMPERVVTTNMQNHGDTKFISRWIEEGCHDLDRSDSIYIFGAGLMGLRAYKALHRKWNILGFIDNDARKSGSELMGVTVYGPDVLRESHGWSGVVVASQYYRQIVEQLLTECGVSSSMVIVWEYRKKRTYKRVRYDTARHLQCKLQDMKHLFTNRKTSETKKTVAIFGHNIRNAYSGGRYAAYMLAEAAAALGYNVWYITNQTPEVLRRGMGFLKRDNIHYRISNNFLYPDHISFDHVIMIPHLGPFGNCFKQAIRCKIANNAKMMLLNFETPNWVNEASLEKKYMSDWLPWLYVAAYSDLVCSISKTGMDYAKAYYSEIGFEGKHDVWYPPVNSIVAESVRNEKEAFTRSIVCLTRIVRGHAHKGAQDLLEIISPALRGITLKIILGRNCEDDEMMQLIDAKAQQFNVQVEWCHKLSDVEKMRAIYQARALLFLSYFEGYGYPPLEALCCNTPCIAYDLPVLRETCGDHLLYAPKGDTAAVRKHIETILMKPDAKDVSLSKVIMGNYDFESAKNKLAAILDLLGS